MTGLLCLQGGREFTAECRVMDRKVLDRIEAGPVGVLAGAARVGSDYAAASERARRHYAGLGADVVIIPDPRADTGAAVDAMGAEIALVVLPGGSPTSLRDVLTGGFDIIGRRLLELHDAGTAISGASAGAMVMCQQMIRPDGPDGADVVDGLGLVPGLALPHWSSDSDRGWPVPDILLWGLPECGGVIIDDDADADGGGGGDEPIAVGAGEPSRRVEGRWVPVERVR